MNQPSFQSSQVSHPRFCDPRCCHSTLTDTHHSSAPVVLDLSGYQIEFQVAQTTDHAFPLAGAETRIRVDVTDVETAEGDPRARHAQIELSVEEWDSIITRLTIERNRARFMSEVRS